MSQECQVHQATLHRNPLKDRHLPFETMDGKHLSSHGYLRWLEVVLNGAVLAVVDQSVFKVVDDFEKNETFNVDGSTTVPSKLRTRTRDRQPLKSSRSQK